MDVCPFFYSINFALIIILQQSCWHRVDSFAMARVRFKPTFMHFVFSKALFLHLWSGSHHVVKCWPHLWCAKRTFIVWGLSKIFITDYLISSHLRWAHWTEDEPNGSIVVIGTVEAQWVHLWLTPQKSSQIVGLRVSFSIQDQQQAMTLISSWQSRPTKCLQPAITC